MKKLLLICSLCLLLPACIPAIFVVGATAGGAVVYDHRGLEQMWQDRKIAHQAQIKINHDSQLAHRVQISIVTFNSVVLMIGRAPSPELRLHAYQIVKKVPHVRRVFNQVKIGPALSVKRIAKDGWITTKVKTDMLLAKGLHSTQIKVVTENGVVYLLGVVSPTQANLAADVARRVYGVRKVVKLFERH